jgi:hypothetical protein
VHAERSVVDSVSSDLRPELGAGDVVERDVEPVRAVHRAPSLGATSSFGAQLQDGAHAGAVRLLPAMLGDEAQIG